MKGMNPATYTCIEQANDCLMFQQLAIKMVEPMLVFYLQEEETQQENWIDLFSYPNHYTADKTKNVAGEFCMHNLRPYEIAHCSVITILHWLNPTTWLRDIPLKVSCIITVPYFLQHRWVLFTGWFGTSRPMLLNCKKPILCNVIIPGSKHEDVK